MRRRGRSCVSTGVRSPTTRRRCRALPGVGRYIAGAILSFAFDRPEPIVEANSQRVLARLLAVREDFKVASTRERLWQAAERLVPAENAGAFNQALIDLGALVCTPREPACLICPLSSSARHGSLAFKIGCRRRPRSLLPWLSRKRPSSWCASGRVLILERARGSLGAILGIPDGAPRRGQSRPADPRADAGDLRESISRVTGITARIGPPVKTIAYSVTKHRVKLIVHLAEASSGDAMPGPGLVDARWVEPERLGDFTFSSAGRRLIAWIREVSTKRIVPGRADRSEFHALKCLDSDS